MIGRAVCTLYAAAFGAGWLLLGGFYLVRTVICKAIWANSQKGCILHSHRAPKFFTQLTTTDLLGNLPPCLSRRSTVQASSYLMQGNQAPVMASTSQRVSCGMAGPPTAPG